MNVKLYINCTVVLLAFGIPVLLTLGVPFLSSVTATVHGTTFAYGTFEPLKNDTVININSNPPQKIVAKNGTYSVELPSGNYIITARYYQNGVLTYYTEESLKIEENGSFIHDFVLFPVNSENLNESEKKSITKTSIDNINNSSGVSTTKQSFESVTEKSKAVELPVISNLVTNLQTPTTKSSRLYSSIGYLLIVITSFFLLIGTSIFLRKYKQIEKPYFKKRKNGYMARFFFEVVNKLKVMPKGSAKDIDPEMRPELKVNNEDAVSVTEVEPKIQKRNMPNIEDYPARETELAKSIIEEEKRISFLEEPAHNSEIDNLVLEKKLLLPSDLQEIIDIIKNQGGLIAQKDLRSKLNYSEVKTSVMLTDLEKRKRIKKIKRGRENFIVLKDLKR
jgi:uncharacterized membrane protein